MVTSEATSACVQEIQEAWEDGKRCLEKAVHPAAGDLLFILAGLCERACKCLTAGKALYAAGCTDDLHSAARTVFELLISGLYVSACPEDRVAMYTAYTDILKCRFMHGLDKWQARRAQVSLPEAFERRRLEDKWRRMDKEQRERRTWSCRDLATMAKDLGRDVEKIYDYLYRWYSCFTHPTPLTIERSAHGPVESVQVSTWPVPIPPETLLLSMCEHALMLIEKTSEVGGLGLRQAIGRCGSRLEEAAKGLNDPSSGSAS